MKILVTGGAGFIGKHLVLSLLNNGDSVTIFDNLSKGTEEKINFLKTKGAKFVKGDITDYESLCSVMMDGIDSVVHLAAKTGVVDSVKYPEETHHINVTGTVRILRACVEKNVNNIVIASSGAVYGESKKLPLSEELPNIPLSPYGASKICAEKYVQAFSNSYGINGISLRFSNVYGEGQSKDYAGVITKFMDNIEKDKPLIIFGDGEQTRDFVFVDDVASGIKKALENISGKKGNFYNIATEKQTSVEELANIMLSISGKSLEIIHEKPREGEIKHNYASIELAKKELDYFPKIELREGLKKLLLENKN